MLDSMIQMQLQTQERLKEAVCKVDKQSDAGRKESFMERMERIRRRNREQRRALDRQFIEKRLAEQESNEKRGGYADTGAVWRRKASDISRYQK